MEKSIEVKNLSKWFGSTMVLDDISFRSDGGEFIVLVGPSGCGKSTLLNLIAGLDEVSSGGIFINGKEVTELSPKERDIAMVFQSYALYPNMTVKENIGFGLKRTKTMSRPEINKVVTDVAKNLQLSPLLDRLPAKLSGGQRQRVAMGRAISRKPEIYLFDEPLSNLDAKLRVEMRIEIKELHKKEQHSIVYVTHDQIEAMTLADKIIVLDKGRIQHEGSPEEVYRFPKNMFVAGFIGSPSMNFIPVDLKTDANGMFVELDGGAGNKTKLSLAGHPAKLDSYVGKKIVLGLRPENIMNHEALTGEESVSPKISAKVNLTELTGPDSYLHTRINGAMTLCRCYPDVKFNQNENTDLGIKTNTIVFFDIETEEIIPHN